MRVTNEQIRAEIICTQRESCDGCPFYGVDNCDNLRGNDFNMYKDLLEARELIKEMRVVIQDSKRFHVNTLEIGRDRIVSLGGLCDSVNDMEKGDLLVINANAILEKTKDYA